MLVLGLGMGMVMQVLVIAMQNGVAYGDLGVATSGATLCRLIGGSLGTAAFGAIFAAGLTAHRADRDLIREHIHAVVGNARVDLSPLAAWLFVRPVSLVRSSDVSSSLRYRSTRTGIGMVSIPSYATTTVARTRELLFVGS